MPLPYKPVSQPVTLRTVARRLASGPDSVSLASEARRCVHLALRATRSALFVRTDGGLQSALSYDGPDARKELLPDDPLAADCWARRHPVHAVRRGRGGAAPHRVVLPLRSGARMVGVVIAEGPERPDPRSLANLMGTLDDHAARLETALLVDEVRSRATMEERQRVAREIHDGVAQEIASLGYLVDDLSAGASSPDQRVALQGLRSGISRVVTELRLSIFELRNDVGPAGGLGSALSQHVAAVGARSGLTVHLTVDEGPSRLRAEVETELLRIAQEAISNARKHSDATNLWVDCQVHPPFARITVEDDGSGLRRSRADSYGLAIMRERTERIGGLLEVGAPNPDKSGTGTRVSVTVGAELTSAA